MNIRKIYRILDAKLGQQPWLENWQETPWEVVYGGILVQNTAWRNVEPSLINLKRNFSFNPRSILAINEVQLQQNIRPSGFYTRKAKTIKQVLLWASQYEFDLKKIRCLPKKQLRQELIALKGIGPETADYIMMYAFDHPGFIVDKYSRRLLSWFGYEMSDSYEIAKQNIENELNLTSEQWQNFHAMIVNLGKIVKNQSDFMNYFEDWSNKG